jgi:hypothetical protein
LELKSIAYDPYTGAFGADISDPAILQAIVDETSQILAQKGVSGRFATWPWPPAIASTVAYTEYAFKWMDGKTNGSFDIEVLGECFREITGVNTKFTPLVEENITYDNYLQLIMDYIIL